MVLEKLADLGFTTASVESVSGNTAVTKIRTSKGWVWERFNTGDSAAIAAWAVKHEPEVTHAD